MGGRGKVAVGDSPWPGKEILEIPDLSAMMVRTKVDEFATVMLSSGSALPVREVLANLIE